MQYTTYGIKVDGHFLIGICFASLTIAEAVADAMRSDFFWSHNVLEAAEFAVVTVTI